MLREQVSTQERAHLLPKLRCQFAEFLNESSSARLSIFYPPTCVGLRYGQLLVNLEAFLGSTVSAIHPLFRRTRSACQFSEYCSTDLPVLPPTTFERVFRHTPRITLSVPPSRPIVGIGILTYLPSTTPFGLILGPDSPDDDEHSVGNLGFTAKWIHTTFIATHACMLTSCRSSAPYRYTFNADRNALLPLLKEIYDFGAYLEPRYIFGAGPLDQ